MPVMSPMKSYSFIILHNVYIVNRQVWFNYIANMRWCIIFTAIAGEMAGWNSASSSITVTVNPKPQPQPVAPTEPSEQPQQN